MNPIPNAIYTLFSKKFKFVADGCNCNECYFYLGKEHCCIIRSLVNCNNGHFVEVKEDNSISEFQEQNELTIKNKMAPNDHNFTSVYCKDLRKGQSYILTYDFYPFGGEIVKLKNKFKANEMWPNARGEGAIVVSTDGKEFAIHPKAYLFDNCPKNEEK